VTALKRKSEDTPAAVSGGAEQKEPHGDTSKLHTGICFTGPKPTVLEAGSAIEHRRVVQLSDLPPRC